MNRIVECVPNFSEGRDLQKIDRIVAPFRGKQGVKLLDYSNDEDHNRLVVTVVGEPEPLRDAVLEAIGVAVQLIDLNKHQGQHPRMGAEDVHPIIPISLRKWVRKWQNVITCLYSSTRNPLRHLTARTLRLSVKESSRAWRRR